MIRLLAPILIFLASVCHATPIEARELGGDTITANAQGTVVMFWSVNDPAALKQWRDLDRLADAGVSVLAVNTDNASQRSNVRAFMHRFQLTNPTAVDPNGALQQRLGAQSGQSVFWSDDEGADRVHWRGENPIEARPVAFAQREAVVPTTARVAD